MRSDWRIYVYVNIPECCLANQNGMSQFSLYSSQLHWGVWMNALRRSNAFSYSPKLTTDATNDVTNAASVLLIVTCL